MAGTQVSFLRVWRFTLEVLFGLETSHPTLSVGQIRTGVGTLRLQDLGFRIPQAPLGFRACGLWFKYAALYL